MEGKLFTDFRVLIKDKDNLKAVVSCKVADCCWLTGIRVVEGSRGKFISMPSRKNTNGEYEDIFFPTSREVRESLQVAVLTAYSAAVEGKQP